MKNFRSLTLIWVFIFVLFSQCGLAEAQLNVRVITPTPDYEIGLGDSLKPRVRVTNAGPVTSQQTLIRFRIQNVVSGIAAYADSTIVPSLHTMESVDLTFRAYLTNPNILSQLGTFDACLESPNDTSCSHLFGLRRTTQPFRDPSNYYGSEQESGTTVYFPDQTKWVASLGVKVVEGETSTWDPPPPRDLNGYGPGKLHDPVIRFDRTDPRGKFYNGFEIALTSFPFNLKGHTRMNLSFDYFRGGRIHYPLFWDSSVMQGPESTILDSAGKVIRAGDQMILQFLDPAAPPINPGRQFWNDIATIDGGHDFEFKSFIAQGTQDSWRITIDGVTHTISTPNYLDSNFRFRLLYLAKDDAPVAAPPVDDGDPWFVDNLTLQRPALPELEVKWVRVVDPFTQTPRSLAIYPVYVDVMNSSSSAQSIPLRVDIQDGSGHTFYSQRIILGSLGEGVDSIVRFPDWNASSGPFLPDSAYRVTATIDQTGLDDYPDDDRTTSWFYLKVDDSWRFDQSFAFDDAGLSLMSGAGNDIPSLTKQQGTGIGFAGSTGSVAMKFTLARRDTLYGVKVYFANGNQSNDPVRISFFHGDANSCVPLDTLSTFLDIRKGGFFNQFWPYYCPKALVLPPGTYWVAVSQLSTYNMQLGGDFSRGGGAIVASKINKISVEALGSKYGTQWGPGPSDNNGAIGCNFALEIPAGSNNWKQFTPDSGVWPALNPNSDTTLQPRIPIGKTSLSALSWTGAGTYLPMIRPIIGTNAPAAVRPNWAVPASLSLSVQPNPFDPAKGSTTFTYSLSDPGKVTLTITNILGAVVRTLVNTTMSAGAHSIAWDGRDETGASLPAGAYAVLLQSPDRRVLGKLMVRN
jgi:hypothetical protein